MKILLIHTADYLHHLQPSRQHAIFEILADTHDVYVLHFHVSNEYQRSTRLHVVEATKFHTKNPVLHYTLNAPHHYRVICDLIKKEGIEVIVTSNVLASTAAILAGKQYGVPVIFDVSDWLPDSAAAYAQGKWMKELVRWTVLQITKWNLKNCSQILTVSPHLKKRIEYYSGGKGAIIVTNGVDADIFKPVSKAQQKKSIVAFGGYQDLDGAFIIGFVGALETWYDIESMIKAMPALLKLYPDTRMLIVGGSLFTDQANKLRALTLSMGLEKKVIFTGYIPYDNLPAYLGAMDICAIPLVPKEWAEIALPNKFYEYSAMGKPIIMTYIPDIIEIGRDLFIYKSEDEYIKCIDRFRKLNWTERPVIVANSWKSKAEQFEVFFRTVKP